MNGGPLNFHGYLIPWFFVRQPRTMCGWQNRPRSSLETQCLLHLGKRYVGRERQLDYLKRPLRQMPIWIGLTWEGSSVVSTILRS